MKKIMFSAIACLFISGVVMAQSLSPEVIASSGDYYESGGTSLSWTLGEIAIETLDNGSNILTQGFHQTMLIPVSVPDDNVLQLRVYPNPTSDKIIISTGTTANNLELQLFDVQGRQLTNKKLAGANNELNLQNLSKGIYILRITEMGQLYASYKIQKIR